MRFPARSLLLLSFATLVPIIRAPLLVAQDSTIVKADTVVRGSPDSLGPRAPVSPLGALWRSFLIPGWGQSKLDRKLTGGIFVAWEGVTLGMTLKTSHELHYLRRTGSGRVESKRQEREDWIILLGFNHLLSGLEAYVSAHLWDFPEDLKIRAVPGGIGGTVSLPPLR
jgi:hypothetical protein